MADEKTTKYDRQLRLWGEHGQELLEKGSIALLNATAVGTEALKNLVLPDTAGVGSFTIVDGKIVDGADVGNNFFLLPSDIGRPRAQAACELLRELNEGDVTGAFIHEDPERLLQANPEALAQFKLIIATDLSEAAVLALSDLCWARQIPLMVVRTFGLVGYLRIVVPEHAVLDGRPDNAPVDLRLDRPLPGVTALVDALDWDAMDSQQRSHTPWLLILLHFLRQWHAEHGGRAPETRAEKDEFKQRVRAFKYNVGQKNFDEAVANAHRVWIPSSVPGDVRAVLADPAADTITPTTPPFWIMVRALRDFVSDPNDGNGLLPLNGALPDMESDTATYVQLQSLYREKAQQDLDAFNRRLNGYLAALGRPPEAISVDERKRFAKNAAVLSLLRYRRLREEWEGVPQGLEAFGPLEESDLLFYVLLRAVWRFERRHGRCPGGPGADVAADADLLRHEVTEFCNAVGLQPTAVPDDHVREMCRYGGAELHNVAAVLGGVIAQEAVKLLTHQFVPLNNTFIFNGIRGSTVTADL